MRADTVSLIDKLAREHRLKKKEYLALLENASVEEHVHAAMLADKERRRIYGTEVFIRGLIEVGNICRNNCYYCGIRASNGKCVRYTLTDKQILACCREGHEIGFRSFVLQGGEGAFPVERVIRIVSEIRGEFPDCAITLSLGEYERDEYEKMFNAGANRCCSQGLEFVLTGKHTYPDDYPELGSEITVSGTFELYEEGDNRYCRLVDAEMIGQ